MTTVAPALSPDSTGALLGNLVGLLADLYSDPDGAEERAAERIARETAAADARRREAEAAYRAAIEKQGMLPVAVSLARSLAAGDQAGVDALLFRQRSLPEWRQLAVILARAASVSRIPLPETS